ncbi:hypothetical protein AAFF_G00339180 [Aldrovandia affinis]|uniref:Phosphoinositide 3-kinase regulatory subunit 6 n=1 Tax=Aldrovandia affinis TaxID=143900 RepID=A0AAD7WPE6_9TELE|nr:hypothetical protein AAFF_G00339180 [Aldrovandia affinis]
MVPTGGGASSLLGPDIFRSVQAILQELDCQNPSSSCHKGLLRWTLHKKVEKDPSSGAVLVEVLVKELERVHRVDSKGHVIPLLLTLIYAVIQSVHIPDDLYKKAYDSCRSFLTLPQPYCVIGLSCARRMHTERSTPGTAPSPFTFQVFCTSGQSVRSRTFRKIFAFQEIRVFVFGDAAVFSGPLGDAVQRDLELAGSQRGVTPLDHMRSVVQHTLQAALGTCCHGNTLARALKDVGRPVESYFQEVVEAVEQSTEEVGDEDRRYRARLQRLYFRILSAAREQSGKLSGGSLCSTPLPAPEVRFHLWREDAELWLQLNRFIRQRWAGTTADSQRASQLSTDSGIERDLPESKASEAPPDGSGWRNSLKSPSRANSVDKGRGDSEAQGNSGNSGTAPPKESHQFTACLVVMGDDRVLGRLAKAYHMLRTGRVRCRFLTPRVNLEMFYVPVTDQCSTSSPLEGRSYLDLASYLGKVDPWYESNVNSLVHMIPTLTQTHTSASVSSDPSPFLLDVLSNYTRMAQQPIHFAIYAIKITFSDLTRSPEEDMFLTHLEVDFPECIDARATLKGQYSKRKKTIPKICGPVVSIKYTKVSLSNREVDSGLSLRTSGILVSAIPSSDTEDLERLTVRFKETLPSAGKEPLIRTRNMRIWTLEQRTFNVCLDKNSHRTYKDVQSIEISPCPDPDFLQNANMSGLGVEKEAGLCKHFAETFHREVNSVVSERE